MIIFLLTIFSEHLFANAQDSTFSVYRNGKFESFCKIKVNASDSIAIAVIKDFNLQLQTEFDNLFDWAFKGLKLQGEQDGLMSFKYKSGTFNKNTQVLRCVGDVIVPYSLTLPDLIIDCRLSKPKFTNSQNIFYVNLIRSNTFLKTLNGSFKIEYKNKECYYILDMQVSFGWFFDLFITEYTYKEIAEWRLKKFITNLKEEAERRKKLIP